MISLEAAMKIKNEELKIMITVKALKIRVRFLKIFVPSSLRLSFISLCMFMRIDMQKGWKPRKLFTKDGKKHRHFSQKATDENYSLSKFHQKASDGNYLMSNCNEKASNWRGKCE